MAYIDGFILPLSKGEIDSYFAAAQAMALIWKEYGALSVVEALEDDAPYGTITSFPRAVQRQEGEVVVYSYITYPDRATRNAVSKKVMSDPRIAKIMEGSGIDGKRMIWGGFEVRVSE